VYVNNVYAYGGARVRVYAVCPRVTVSACISRKKENW